MASGQAAQAKPNGVVLNFTAARGYGFLRAAVATEGIAEEQHVYFHISKCDVQHPVPVQGERVAFTWKKGPKGLAADVVRRVEVSLIAASSADETKDTRRPSPIEESNATRLPGVGTRGPPPKEPTAPPPSSATKSKSPKTKRFDAAKDVETRRRLLADSPSSFQGGTYPRFVYVDLDNVWVSFARAEYLVGKFPGANAVRDLDLDLEGLTRRFAAGGGGSSAARLVAFYYNTPESVAERLRRLTCDGLTWEVWKQETTTDTTMQLELLRAKRPCISHPKTLVLVTGDGNVAPNGMCFREILDLYLRDAWFVEVHAWLHTMATSYIQYQREYASTVVIRLLDDDNVGEIVRLKQRAKRDASDGDTARSVASLLRCPECDGYFLTDGALSKHSVLHQRLRALETRLPAIAPVASVSSDAPVPLGSKMEARCGHDDSRVLEVALQCENEKCK